MRKKLSLIIILLAIQTAVYAQTGGSVKKYYINGSLSVGRGTSFVDGSAWVHIADTPYRGIILPRVILDSIKTQQLGLFVYGLADSVLYHFDGTKRVRYMTYKDTNYIKGLAGNALDTKYVSYIDSNAKYISKHRFDSTVRALNDTINKRVRIDSTIEIVVHDSNKVILDCKNMLSRNFKVLVSENVDTVIFKNFVQTEVVQVEWVQQGSYYVKGWQQPFEWPYMRAPKMPTGTTSSSSPARMITTIYLPHSGYKSGKVWYNKYN